MYVFGAVLLLGVSVLTASPAMAKRATVREYFIAADEVAWDYAPSFPLDPMTGQEFSDEHKLFLQKDYKPGFIGRVYTKALFRQYTDGTFAHLVEQPRHLGLLGPVIRAEVGDTILVHFRNNARFPTSLHPHGVFYAKDSEGSPYTDSADDLTNTAPGDDNVSQGGEWTYTWEVPQRAGPGPADPSSVAWPYHSHPDEPGDTNAGLIGFIVITKEGWAKADGSPKDVERELFSLFTVFNENASSLTAANGADAAPEGADPDEFEESNLMHGINGLIQGNNRGYDMTEGQRVRWYLLGMGTEVDVHTVHWHGVTVLWSGHRKDVIPLSPAVTETVDLTADNPGTWMLHCHVNDHILAGMMTKFTIQPRAR
jgi:FtsP/CotA-like multicopper oxidase with cupredoxin domain